MDLVICLESATCIPRLGADPVEDCSVLATRARESGEKSSSAAARDGAALAKATDANERLKKALTELRGKHREALAKGQEASEAGTASAALLAEKDALVSHNH